MNAAAILDLTHCISPKTPVYPGTNPPKLIAASSLEKEGFRETLLQFYSHTGTHMDGPSHLFPTGVSLDNFDVAQFAGRGLVLDCRDLSLNCRIPRSRLESEGARLEDVDFLLLRTGWERYFGAPEYFRGYPCLSPDAAAFLVQLGLKGVGVDAISVDPVEDPALHIHRILLEDNKRIIVENLCHLDQLGKAPFFFAALPLHYANADGAPVRAIAIR